MTIFRMGLFHQLIILSIKNRRKNGIWMQLGKYPPSILQVRILILVFSSDVDPDPVVDPDPDPEV